MKNLKQILTLLSLLILFSANSFSQIIFEKGYIISNANEKIECYIKNLDWNNTPKSFQYKTDENSDVLVGDLSNVKEFRVESGQKFVRNKTRVDRANTSVNTLGYNRNPEFKEFVKDVAMQIAAQAPKYISRDEVPVDVVEKEKEVLTQQALNEGKPEHIVEQMVNGRLNKFYEEICLLDQPFIKDGDVTINDLLTDLISRIGENIVIRRFERYELGEGLEKREDNLAEEVAAQLK